MAKAIITSDNDAVISETEIAAPPERIFHALTTPEALARWFTNPGCPVKFWKMDARRGVQYSYETQRGTVVVNGADEFECHGEILEIDPPRLLVYTWIGSWHNNKDLRTVVRWELTLKAAALTSKLCTASSPRKMWLAKITAAAGLAWSRC